MSGNADAWEWELAEDLKITARVQWPQRIESVWMGPRLVSRSTHGGKAEGHTVRLPPPKTANEAYRTAGSSGEAIVTYDEFTSAFRLEIDGRHVPLTRGPDLLPPGSFAPGSQQGGTMGGGDSGVAIFFRSQVGRVAMLGIGVVVAMGAFKLGIALTHRQPKLAAGKTELTSTMTSEDGAIAAHYPDDFVATHELGGAAIRLHREARDELLVLAVTSTPVTQDPKALHRVVLDGLAKETKKERLELGSLKTEEGTCKGFPGMRTTTELSDGETGPGSRVKLSLCTMIRSARAYFFGYILPTDQGDGQEAELQRIVDATDIFDLPAPLASLMDDHGDRPTPTQLLSFAPRTSHPGGTARIPRAPRHFPPMPRVNAFPQPSPTAYVHPNLRPGANGPQGNLTTMSARGVHPVRGPEGPPHVHGVSKAADDARDQRMRDYRDRVPW